LLNTKADLQTAHFVRPVKKTFMSVTPLRKVNEKLLFYSSCVFGRLSFLTSTHAIRILQALGCWSWKTTCEKKQVSLNYLTSLLSTSGSDINWICNQALRHPSYSGSSSHATNLKIGKASEGSR